MTIAVDLGCKATKKKNNKDGNRLKCKQKFISFLFPFPLALKFFSMTKVVGELAVPYVSIKCLVVSFKDFIPDFVCVLTN